MKSLMSLCVKTLTGLTVLLVLSSCSTLGFETESARDNEMLKELAIPPEIEAPIKSEDNKASE